MTPLLGYLPDADPTRAGIITDCQHLQPTAHGYVGAPAPVSAGADPLPGPCNGAVVAMRLDGQRRVLAGTADAIYQLTGGSWTDMSKSGGYSGGPDSRWSWTQFGDTTMASNFADPMQQSNALTTDFSDVPTAPRAKIIVSASNNFVLAFNTVDPTYGESPDRWWCSAQNNQNDWTPDVSTGANTGRLIAEEGPIVAAAVLGDYVVAYKERGIFLGSYVGSPLQFQWVLIPGSSNAGAVGIDAVCDIGGAHFCVGRDSFWIFDGTRPMPIGAGEARAWFYATVDPAYLYRTQCSFDPKANLVHIAFPSQTSGGALDRVLTYSTLSKQWGRDDQNIGTAINFIRPGLVIDQLDTVAATIDTLPPIPVDSPYWVQSANVPSYFDPAGNLWSLSGVTEESMFTTGDLGDDDQVSMLKRFRVRYTQRPSAATATGLSKFNEGDPLIPGPVNAINDGKFDLRQTGRFHRVRVDMIGDHRMTAFDGAPIAAGQR